LKLKIDQITKTDYADKDGNTKYSVLDGNGEKRSTTDERLVDKAGQVVEVDETHGVFKNKPWSKITLKETVKEVESPESKVPAEVWENKDIRMARMSALKSAADIASAKIGLKEKISSLDVIKVADVFYGYIYNGKVAQAKDDEAPEPELSEEQPEINAEDVGFNG